MKGRHRWLVHATAAAISCSAPMICISEVDAVKPPSQFIRLKEAIAIIQREYISPVDANALINVARTNIHQRIGDRHECEHVESAADTPPIASLEKEYDCIVVSNPSLAPNHVIDDAISSLMTILDVRSKYISEDDEKKERPALINQASIGLEVHQNETGVGPDVTALPSSPAKLLGIKAGDRLVEIDGKSTSNQSLQTVVNWLRGPFNSEIHIALERDNQRLEFVTRRELIKYNPVESELLSDGVGYIKVGSFQKNTGLLIQEHVKKLGTIRGQKLGGFVIDLRRNSGGFLNEIASSADAFIDDGELFRVSGRSAASKLKFGATKGDLADQAPLVVLVDGGTSAGAELLAATLHDRRNATVIGTRTFGLDTVVTMINLQGGGQLHLTTAKLYRPSEVPFEGIGILPDICVLSASEVKPIDQSTGREPDASRLACPSQNRWYNDRGEDVELRTALDSLKEKLGHQLSVN